jgi:hypothetical protein
MAAEGIGAQSGALTVARWRARIPTPKRDMDKPFLMPVENSFLISGRGTVVTGKVDLSFGSLLRRRFSVSATLTGCPVPGRPPAD